MNPLRLPATLVLTIAAAALGAAESSTPAIPSPSDEVSIRELETRSWIAWKSHDAAFFKRFLSQDHVEVHPYGIVGKSAVVEGVRSPACIVQSYSLGPFAVTPVSADAILLTYRAEQNTSCGGLKVPSPVWATSLYARRAGRWTNILYQHTPVARD
jgi:hypothetical protein